MIDTRPMRRFLGSGIGLLALACAGAAQKSAPREAVEVQSDPACFAISETRQLRGVLQRKDLGRGMEGLFLQTDEAQWLLSYSVLEELEPLVGHRVEVTGKSCERQGRAVVAPYFNPERVQPVE